MRSFFLFFLCLFLLNDLVAQEMDLPFKASWQFHKPGETKWYKAEVPGTIHTDLLANKLIPDPFYRDNEKKVQWVEKADWEYKTSFAPDPQLLSKKNITLVFDGLDTYAKVYLNDQLILQADNMFRQWKADVKNLLKKQGNELRILFSSAARHDDSLAAISAIPLSGENNRMYSRKAQYQYGWDWGPRLVTCGIWKPIHWEAWDEKKEEKENEGRTWDVKLITKPDSIGQSFYFTVNGHPTFMKGANWIPCESFSPRAGKLDLYRKLLKEAKEAHINMLRVWGGGIYEDDEFYDLCDQYGIMIWQDFMFAGAMYPGDEHFLKNVEEEIRYQVQRLRHHPCIVLWCGNNEIDEAWHNWGWQREYHYSPQDSTKLWSDYQKLFHELIPGILKELDPQRPYWPSSPSIGWGREQSYKQGDVHYWGVWWGKEPVEKYREKVGRFNSEYGMQGFPSMNTIRHFTIPADLDTSSSAMRTHQKHPFGYPNIKLYIEKKFHAPKKFEDLVYVSQLMQADAIGTAIEAHRANMPFTMGTLFWQWNDCWPVVSWSAVDYFGNKKALYYETKREYAPYLLSIPVTDSPKLKLNFISDLDTTFEIEVEATAFDFSGRQRGRLVQPIVDMVERQGPLLIRIPKGFANPEDFKDCYWQFTVKSGKLILAQQVYLFLPPKELNLKKPLIRWKWLTGDKLELTTDKFAYGVFLDLPEGVEPDDNYFYLLPGEKKIIQFTGHLNAELLKKSLKIKSLVDTY